MEEETIKYKEAKLETLILDKLDYYISHEDTEMINLLTKLLELLRK